MGKISLLDYKRIVGPSIIEELKLLASRVAKSIKMVNSTAVGGGVAEILARLLPLLNELGIPTRWEVIKGAEDFFGVTKAFHNALHGFDLEVTEEMFEIFLDYSRWNAGEMSFEEEVIVIHDPQPIALIEKRKNNNQKWVWRCHIDVSAPNPAIWNFLVNFINRYDASVFSAPAFARILPIPQYMITPSIDPLSDKNKELSDEFIDKVLEKYKIDKNRPIITQISRFDRLKDPLGVIEAYKLAKKRIDCQLVLAGGGASDDPESENVLAEVKEKASSDSDIHVLTLAPFSDLEINVLQRASTIILQKSLREGFGLTVTEALWKGKPVIASAVGGIPLQIIHNFTGILVYSIEGTAYYIKHLLSNPDFAKRLGEFGREHVRERFLLTRNLRNYLLLLITLDYPGQSIIQL